MKKSKIKRKRCPQCDGTMRKMTFDERQDAALDWANAGEHFNSETAIVCIECGYQES